MSVRERLFGWFQGKDELELTEGSVAKPLFFLSLPIVVTNLLQTAYNLADTFWLGQYSKVALAAISFAFPMVFLLIALGMGLSVAGSILVAQHTGADEERKAEYAAAQTVSWSFLASIILGFVGYYAVGPVVRLFGAEPATAVAATAYMQVISLGIVFMFGFFVFISLMRGYGDTITPMLVMLGTVVLNVILDPFLIMGWWIFPELGVEGAAIATVFSRSLAMVVGIVIMLRGSRGFKIHVADLRPDVGYLRRILALGIPASIEGTGRALSVNLMLFVVGLFPTTVVAGYGIGVRIFSVVFLPAIAVARGVETMTGQNIGAGKPDRAASAARTAAIWMFVILSGVGAIVILGGEAIVGVFSDDPEVVRVGAEFLAIVAPTFGFIGLMRGYTGSIRGAGKTLVAAALAITMLGIIRLPAAWVMVTRFDMGTDGIWYAFAISNVIGAILAILYYRTGRWRDADPRGEPELAPADDD